MNSINEKKVKVSDATLSGAAINDGSIEWSINVEIEELDWNGHYMNPRIYLQRYVWDVKNIKDIYNTPIVVKSDSEFSGNDMLLPDSKLCCIYTFEHDFLDNNEIVFYKNLQGNTYINWTASCNTFGIEQLKIHIDTRVEFLGLNLGQMSEEHAKRIIKFDLDGLYFYKENNELYLIPE